MLRQLFLLLALLVVSPAALAIDNYTGAEAAPIDNYTGADEVNKALAVAGATSSDEYSTGALPAFMGKEVYCGVVDFIEGEFGVTIAFLIALYGLFVFLLQDNAKGIGVILTGVAFTFTPALFDSFVAGFSIAISGAETKQSGWTPRADCAGLTAPAAPPVVTRRTGDGLFPVPDSARPTWGPAGWASELGKTVDQTAPPEVMNEVNADGYAVGGG